MRAEPAPATNQVSEDPLPYGQPSSADLQEAGRIICLSLVGSDGRVLACVDMVLMGTGQPLQVRLHLGVEVGVAGNER